MFIFRRVFARRDDKNETDKVVRKNLEKNNCKLGNHSVLVSDLILQLNEDLDDFYLTRTDTTVLFERCNKFFHSTTTNLENMYLVKKNQINFASIKILNILKTSRILKVENASKGTQLKLLVHLNNNITAIVKPKWYSNFDIINGPVYAGKDRHFGEVVAFFISVLMDLPRVPPAAIRIFNLHKEIISVADKKLLSTFITKNNNICFYGVCLYCNPSDLLCTDSKILEGSIIYYLSSKLTLKIMRHPWGRTYKCSTLARWETDEYYCTTVKNSKFYSSRQNRALFLDFMDVAIFDFLISNGDRHHFEYIATSQNPRILMIDNGKSFGNPYADYIDILAPLYQCCKLRNSTFNNLLKLRGGNFSKWLQYLIKQSDRDVVINNLHYAALDRRLLLIFAALKYCFQKHGMQNVIVEE
ncbi:hypothetical protein PGB90_002923 [Kerria lacca]